MAVFKSSGIVFNTDSAPVSMDITVTSCAIFSNSQFFPAADGSWLMVDWMEDHKEWYVIIQEA